MQEQESIIVIVLCAVVFLGCIFTFLYCAISYLNQSEIKEQERRKNSGDNYNPWKGPFKD